MNTLIITSMPGLDGEYPFDFEDRGFSNGELHTIKVISGVRAGEIEEAFKAGDNDLMVALASIVLKRNEKDVPTDALWDAPAGCLTFLLEEDEPEKDKEGKVLPPPNAPDGSANERESGSPSGKILSEPTVPPVGGLPPTGIQP